MWLFQKDPKQIENPSLHDKSRTENSQVLYKIKTFNIGRAIVEYKFGDGTKFKSYIYGLVYQRVELSEYSYTYRTFSFSQGSYLSGKEWIYKDLRIDPVALQNIKERILDLSNFLNVSEVSDDPINPRSIIKGQPVQLTILEFEDYDQEYNVAYLSK